MVVDVVAVEVLEPTVDEEVDMVAVRDLLVTAVRAVHVARFRDRAVIGIAPIRVRARDGDRMLDDATVLLMQQVAVIEVVDMAFVAHGDAVRGLGRSG